MNRVILTTLLVVALLATCALGKRRPKQGRPGSRPNGGRPQPPLGGDFEKSFFCQSAQKACRLQAEDETLLVDQECPGEISCDEGASGTVNLGNDSYTVTFCPRPGPEDVDPIRRLIDEAEKPEPSAALVEICGERPVKPKGRYPLWFGLACKVTEDGENVKRERRCRGQVTCSKGPYEAQLGNRTVQATFCDYQRPTPPPPEGEEPEPFWYRQACEVVKTDGAVLKPKKACPRDMPCSLRLSDMDYEDDQQVNVSFCDGVRLGEKKAKGRPGGRQGGRKGKRPRSRQAGRRDRG